MKSNITSISVHREIRATKYGISRETSIFFIRDNGIVSSYYINSVLDRKDISQASLMRAKHAQNILAAQAKSNTDA